MRAKFLDSLIHCRELNKRLFLNMFSIPKQKTIKQLNAAEKTGTDVTVTTTFN